MTRTTGPDCAVMCNLINTHTYTHTHTHTSILLNPLRMNITTEAGTLFDKHPRRKNNALLLDITIVDPCAGSNLENAARHVGKHLADSVERKKNKYRGLIPAIYSLLSLAMSTYGEVDSDVHALIKEFRHTPTSLNIWWEGRK